MFEQGDLIYVDFDPSAGKEITKTRPAIVLSIDGYNQHGFAIVCPITSAERADSPIFIDLPDNLPVTGQINTMQVRFIDFNVRNARKVGTAPKETTDKCLAIVKAFLGG